MVGFGLDGFEGRVPCPHCGSTDCCGVDKDKLICVHTKKTVNFKQLRESAKKHRMKKKVAP